MVLDRRLKRGKEHRRSGCRAARRELASRARRAAGLGARRQRRRNAGDPAADRAHPRARLHRAGDVRHGDLRRAGRAAVAAGRDPSVRRRSTCRSSSARFLDHWRPNLALFVESDLWPNLIMAGAERGIPLILVNGRVSERSFQRWRLRAAHDRRAAQPLRSLPRAIRRGRRALRRARRAAHRHDRQPQARRAGAAGRCRPSSGSSRPPSARAR